jgi:predicted molibdopterin-dependent oxidoreductase YjgC
MAAEPLRVGVAPSARVRLVVDGDQVEADEGQSVLAALWGSGRRTLHRTARTGEPRAFFCGIGVCFDCLAEVDGVRSVRACVTPVVEGMVVTTQQDAGLLGAADV